MRRERCKERFTFENLLQINLIDKPEFIKIKVIAWYKVYSFSIHAYQSTFMSAAEEFYLKFNAITREFQSFLISRSVRILMDLKR